MRQLKIAIVLLVAIALPSGLAAIWQPLASFDLVLVMVVYFALQREPLNALFIGAIARAGHGCFKPRVIGRGWVFKSAYGVRRLLRRVARHAGHNAAANSGAGGGGAHRQSRLLRNEPAVGTVDFNAVCAGAVVQASRDNRPGNAPALRARQLLQRQSEKPSPVLNPAPRRSSQFRIVRQKKKNHQPSVVVT